MKTGKTFKKLMAMLLAVVMVVGLMPTAFAAETDVALTASLNNISGITNGTIPAGEGLSAVLTAAEGYKLPESITVTGASFTYNITDLTSATLTIDAADITGNVTVSGDAVELKKYTVTWVLTDIKSQSVTEVNEKDGLSVTLEAKEGYRLPDSVSVANATWSYDSASGQLTVAGNAITDNITVTAEAVKTYDVDWSGLKNIAAPAETTVDAVNGLTVTLVADEHYSLPDENKITVTGVDTEGYTYTPSTGVLAINGAMVTGDVTVSAAAKADEFDVTVAADSVGYIEGVTSGKAAFNSTVEFTVKQRDGYAVDSIIGVTAEYKTDHYEFTMPANAVELGVKWKFAAPAVTVNDSDGFKAEDGTVWFKLDDLAATEVKPVSPANSISKDNETWGDSVTGLSEGVNTVYIKDINDVQAEVQVGVDNTAPTAGFLASDASEKTIWGASYTYTMDATDDVLPNIKGSGIGSVKYYVSHALDDKYNSNGFRHLPEGKLEGNDLNNVRSNIAGEEWAESSAGASVTLDSSPDRLVVIVRVEDKVGNEAYYCIKRAIYNNANDKIEFAFDGEYSLNSNVLKTAGKTLLVYNKALENNVKELATNILLNTENNYDLDDSMFNQKPIFSLYTGKAESGKPAAESTKKNMVFNTGAGAWERDAEEKLRFHFGIQSENESNKWFSELEDGVYTLFADLEMNNKKMTNSNVVFVSNSKPGTKVSYSGMNGYDVKSGETSTYAVGGTQIIDDKVDPAVEAPFVSNYKLFTNGKADTTVAFDKATYNNGDSAASYPYTSTAEVKLNGAVASTGIDVKNATGDATKVSSVVIGSSAAEGEYTIDYTLTGFNEQEKKIQSTVVVDKLPPITAQTITAKSFDEDGSELSIKPNGWTKGGKIELSLAGISDPNLLENCVTLYKGTGAAKQKIAAPATLTDGVWNSTTPGETKTYAISGEQNQTYTVEVADKAGNITPLTYTVMVDTTPVKAIEVHARNGNTDAALITDVFTFGVFHKDYTALSVHTKDEKAEGGVEDAVSGIEKVDYYFLERAFSTEDKTYEKLLYKQDIDGNVLPYLLDDGDRDAAMMAYMKNTANLWAGASSTEKESNPDSTDRDVYLTGQIAANKEFIAFFRVTDNAGNESFFYRASVITDTEEPTISFSIEQPIQAGDIFTDEKVVVSVDVEDPNDAYSGINKVSYEVFRSAEDTEPFMFGDLLEQQNDLTEAQDEKKEGLLPQGAKTFSKPIYLMDDNEKGSIDSNNIYIVVAVEDIAGNTKKYDSREYGVSVTDGGETHQIYSISIDKIAPEVILDIDNMSAVNDRYYPAVRNMKLTVKDLHFDPATCVSYVDNCTGTIQIPEVYSEDLTDRVWTRSAADSYGYVTYYAEVKFGEGDHIFGFTEVKDNAENYALNKADDTDTIIYTFNEEENDSVKASLEDFVVDLTAPVAALTFTRTDGKAFDEYNNCSVNVTVTVAEQNFSPDGANLTVNGVPTIVAWTGGDGSYNATFTLNEDNAYDVRAVVTDLAGNTSEPEEEHFVIDTVLPEIKISGVKDKSAYKAEKIIPVIDVTDTNYDGSGVEITLAGSNGGNGYYDAKDIDSGEKFTFENIEDDDMYTLTVTAKDLAENESAQTIVFSVNRNGSVFTANEVLAKAMENGIPYYRTDNLPKISIFETNVDIIKQAKLYLVKDSTGLDLTSNDYQAIRKDVNGGWSQYEYVLNSELFADDGVYRLSLVTVDAAGNEKNAEEVVAFVVDNTAPVLFANDLKSGGIYNEETKHVVFTPNDNIVLSRISVVLDGNEIASWDSEQIAQIIRDGGEFGFDVPESNALRNLSIVLTDAAGNTNENPLFENVLVSTNFFVRFYNNKPVFYSTIAGVVLIGGGLWFFLTKKKKEQDTETAEEEDI